MRAKTLLFATAGLCALSPVGAQARDASVSEVVVTAAPYAVSLDSATTSVNVVSRADLDTAPAAGLGDVLNGLPGLRSTFYGPGASRPIIRGLSGPRVMVLQNGVGLVDASALSPDHAVASEPSEASRIEVLRGPSTLAYGGSAIGGVVNMLDDRVPTAIPANGAKGRAAAAAGSADDSYSTSMALQAARGRWVVALDASKRESDDYRVPVNPVSDRLAAATGEVPLDERRVRNTDVDLKAFGAGLSYVGDDGYVGASIKRTETRYGLPFAQVELTGPPPEEGPVFIDLRQTRLDLRGERAVDFGPFERARVAMGYADYEHAEISVDTGETGTRFLSKGTEGRAELIQRERGGWQGAVGVQGLTRELEAIGDEAFVPPVDITEIGIFTLQRLDKGGWGVEGGARFDRRDLDAGLAGRDTSEAAAAFGTSWESADSKQAFSNVSASAAVFWRPAKDLFLSVSVARNRRAPTEFELFADGPHPGTGAYELGDPTLKSEKVTSWELTARWTGERARLEGHAYTARYDGFIEQAPTGDLVDDEGMLDPDGELPVFRFTQTDATFHGGEVEGSYAVWREGERSLSVEGAFDYVHAKTDSGPVARIPPYSLTGRVVWADPRLDARLEVRHVGEQDRIAAFELPTDSYTLINVLASYRLIAGRDLRIFAEGRNLTNQEAREHASFLKDIAPLPGRSLRAGLALSF